MHAKKKKNNSRINYTKILLSRYIYVALYIEYAGMEYSYGVDERLAVPTL